MITYYLEMHITIHYSIISKKYHNSGMLKDTIIKAYHFSQPKIRTADIPLSTHSNTNIVQIWKTV